MNACCNGCSTSPFASPSTVRIFLPCACTANMRHDRIASPCMITVQVPQTPCSQPIWVPVCPQSSRMASTRVLRGSTRMAWSRPLIVRVMSILSIIQKACVFSLPHPEEAAKRPSRRMVRDALLRNAPHHEIKNSPRQHVLELLHDALVQFLAVAHDDGEGVAPVKRPAGVDDHARIARIFLAVAHGIEHGAPAAAQN